MTVLKLVELYFEAIFKSDYVYDKDSLIKIYDLRKQHKRYQNFIDKFYNDLLSALMEKRNSVKEMFENKIIDKNSFNNMPQPKINILLTDSNGKDEVEKPRHRSYNYEIGKIATKRNSIDFDFFGGLLKAKCKTNILILEELHNMEKNIINEIEYYTSLRLMCLELREV